MTYELVRELSDAGFPMPRRWGDPGELLTNPKCACKTGRPNTHEPNSHCLLMTPRLSELIEACGDDFDVISRAPWGGWQAVMSEKRFELERGKNPDYCVIECDGHESGETPEEAVARLWLALNKP